MTITMISSGSYKPVGSKASLTWEEGHLPRHHTDSDSAFQEMLNTATIIMTPNQYIIFLTRLES